MDVNFAWADIIDDIDKTRHVQHRYANDALKLHLQKRHAIDEQASLNSQKRERQAEEWRRSKKSDSIIWPALSATTLLVNLFRRGIQNLGMHGLSELSDATSFCLYAMETWANSRRMEIQGKLQSLDAESTRLQTERMENFDKVTDGIGEIQSKHLVELAAAVSGQKEEELEVLTRIFAEQPV